MRTQWAYTLGKSYDWLSQMPRGFARAVITDPPYGTANKQYGRRQNWGGDRNHGSDQGAENQRIEGDADLTELALTLPHLDVVLAPTAVAMLFCAPTERRRVEDCIHSESTLQCQFHLVWFKGQPGIGHRVRYRHEEIIVCTHRDVDPFESRPPIMSVLECPPERDKLHPNQKPVGLLAQMTAWAMYGAEPYQDMRLIAGSIADARTGAVVDPFAGVASGGVASLKLGYPWYGIECDGRWVPDGEARLRHASFLPSFRNAQMCMFSEEPTHAIVD